MDQNPRPQVQRDLTVIKLNREKFLQKLEEVTPGLSRTGIQEQTACFAFRKGLVCTYNNDVFCSAKTKLPEDFVGAVQAKKLIDLIREMTTEDIVIKPTKRQFVVIGNNEASGLRMEPSILIPLDRVETPTEWKPLHPDFTDAVGIVSECASKNQELFTCTCIHLHPKWMEAFDNAQMTRYKLKTGVSRPFLVRRDALKYIPSFDFVEFAETKKWIHFRTSAGSIMSCLRYLSESKDFQDLTPYLKIRGEETTLPKTLTSAAKKAEIFSKDEDDDLVLCELADNRMKITGRGPSGWYKRRMQVRYKGAPVKFRVSPRLLMELLKRHTECEISDKRVLRVNGGKFVYAVCLEDI